MPEKQKVAMEWLDELHKIENKIRESETKKAIGKMLALSDNIRMSINMIAKQLNPLELDIKSAIDDEQFKHKVDVAYNGLSIKINFYIDQSFSFVYNYAELTNTVSNCIKELVKIIDYLYSEQEETVAKEIKPPQEETIAKPNQEDPFDEIFGKKDNLPEETESSEEEEEILISKYSYHCIECENDFENVGIDGCIKCGNSILQTKYLN